MTDSLQRFLFEGAPVRGEIAHLDATWRAVLERHDYPASLRSAMGELMAAAALLSATLKFTGSLIMQVQGSGPVKLIVVECTSDQTMRATAKWDGELPAGSFRELVGNGRFVITIAPTDAKQTYQGIVALEGDSVAAVLEHYMTSSEQLETRLWLAADTRQAAGMLVQRVPGAAGTDPDAWNRAVKLSETVTAEELLKLPARQIIRRLYHEEDIRVFECARGELSLLLLARPGGEHAAPVGPRRSAVHPRRARQGGGELRVLQPALRLRPGRRRAGVRGRGRDSRGQHSALRPDAAKAFP